MFNAVIEFRRSARNIFKAFFFLPQRRFKNASADFKALSRGRDFHAGARFSWRNNRTRFFSRRREILTFFFFFGLSLVSTQCAHRVWKLDRHTRKGGRRPFFQSDIDALLTRYAGDKFERSQHAYRTQRTQIHLQVYARRERRDDPAPKTHTPRHTLLLSTLLH